MNLKELAPKTTQRLNKVMESRFGFAIDYDNLTYAKAQRLSKALAENINAIKKTVNSKFYFKIGKNRIKQNSYGVIKF